MITYATLSNKLLFLFFLFSDILHNPQPGLESSSSSLPNESFMVTLQLMKSHFLTLMMMICTSLTIVNNNTCLMCYLHQNAVTGIINPPHHIILTSHDLLIWWSKNLSEIKCSKNWSSHDDYLWSIDMHPTLNCNSWTPAPQRYLSKSHQTTGRKE